jgi:hypothetical protein
MIHAMTIASFLFFAVAAMAVDLKWGGIAQLVAHPGVQRELHVTPAQKSQLASLAGELEQSKASHKQASDALSKVLTAEQMERLEQVRLQVLDGLALEDPELADQLKLSTDQRKLLKKVVAECAADEREMNDVMKRARFPNPKSRRDFIKKYREKASQRFKSILTPPQKELFAKLKGKPLPEPVEPP